MLKLLPFLTCLIIINALESGSIKDCDLQAPEHFNLQGLEITENVEFLIIMNCSGIIDNKTFTAFPKLSMLNILYSNIKEINTTLSIKHLDVSLSHFPNLDEDLQQKLPELVLLRLSGNKDFQFDPHILKNFKKLTSLSIFLTNVTEVCVTKEWFEGLNLLQSLTLGHNNISCISEDAFENLKNLRKLDLSFNHISNFKKATFKKLTKLTFLNFYRSDIGTIDLSNFASQKNSLVYLGISWNALKQSNISSEELLKAFPKLQILRLHEKDSKAIEFCEILGQNGVYARCSTY